ncbi:ubiquitin-conjugating enzyme E2 C isoform X1 [Sigmodon hispidus]
MKNAYHNEIYVSRTCTTICKGAESSEGTAQGSVGQRLQQKLLALMMSSDKGASAFPESDDMFKWGGRATSGTAGTVHEDLRYKFSLEFPGGYLYNTQGESAVSAIMACEATTLAHESWDNPVKGGTLYPDPFSPVLRARKFSAIFGTLSANSSEEMRPKGSPSDVMSKNKVGLTMAAASDKRRQRRL